MKQKFNAFHQYHARHMLKYMHNARMCLCTHNEEKNTLKKGIRVGNSTARKRFAFKKK